MLTSSVSLRCTASLKRGAFAVASALAIFVVGGSSSAAPPQRVIPVEAVFTPGYSISGVGGAYRHGADGVECDINLNTGDFRLNINQNRSRWLVADLSQPINVGCPVVSPPPDPWVSPLTDVSFVNVNKIKDMAISSAWMQKGAFFLSRSAGQIRFAQGSLEPFCSTTVWVQHPAANTWIVRATSAEVAVLVQSYKNQAVPVGHFTLPFELTITAQ